MDRMQRTLVSIFVILLASSSSASDANEDAVARGRDALLGKSHLDGRWTIEGYRKLENSDPAAFREKYGLHPAAYENHGLPMGLRQRDGDPKHVVLDCMICHGGSL